MNSSPAPHSRRTHLRLLAAGASGIAAAAATDVLAAALADVLDLPMTGDDDPRLRSFDRLMASFVTLHDVPGAALAVAKDSRLVYARGFGLGDLESREAVQPGSLFRIASVSKPITAAAVMQLAERGKLSLEDKAFEILEVEPFLAEGASPDPRLKQITVLQLLQHTAGWDRDQSFDPMVGWPSVEIAKALGVPPPALSTHIVRYMAGRPLDFPPGQRYAYSNFGYCVLGRIIEKLSGQAYEAYVREHVLAPLGIRRMQIGRTLAAGRAAGEVKYYDEHRRTAPAVMGEEIGKPVPLPYGTWHLEAMDAHGGWIASAVDLVRFASALDQPARCKILHEKSIAAMFARPAGSAGYEPDGRPKTIHYACGWSAVERGNKGGANHWHLGGLDGTAAILVRRADGLNWAALFNAGRDLHGNNLGGAIDSFIHVAADKVQCWPDEDLFEKLL